MSKHYNALIISGGSIKGLAALGALQYLQDNGHLHHIQYYAGTSVGAMICFLLALGYTPEELMEYICVNQIIEKIRENRHSFTETISKKGIYNYKIIQDTLETLTLTKNSFIPTLEEFYTKTNQTLLFTTYNLTKQKKEYISHENYPNLSCLDAIRMSCNLPFIFEEFTYNQCDYIDGGLIDNFPITAFHSLKKPIKKIKKIGVNLNYTAQIPQNNSILFKMYSILMVPILERECEKIKHHCHNKIITVETGEKKFLFDISNQEKLNLFSIGFQTAKKNF